MISLVISGVLMTEWCSPFEIGLPTMRVMMIKTHAEPLRCRKKTISPLREGWADVPSSNVAQQTYQCTNIGLAFNTIMHSNFKKGRTASMLIYEYNVSLSWEHPSVVFSCFVLSSISIISYRKQHTQLKLTIYLPLYTRVYMHTVQLKVYDRAAFTQTPNGV